MQQVQQVTIQPKIENLLNPFNVTVAATSAIFTFTNPSPISIAPAAPQFPVKEPATAAKKRHPKLDPKITKFCSTFSYKSSNSECDICQRTICQSHFNYHRNRCKKKLAQSSENNAKKPRTA